MCAQMTLLEHPAALFVCLPGECPIALNAETRLVDGLVWPRQPPYKTAELHLKTSETHLRKMKGSNQASEIALRQAGTSLGHGGTGFTGAFWEAASCEIPPANEVAWTLRHHGIHSLHLLACPSNHGTAFYNTPSDSRKDDTRP